MKPILFFLLIGCASLSFGDTTDKTFNQAQADKAEELMKARVSRAFELGKVVAENTKVHFEIGKVKWYPKANAWAFFCRYEHWNWVVLIYPLALEDTTAIELAFMQAEVDQLVFWNYLRQPDKGKPAIPKQEKDDKDDEETE